MNICVHLHVLFYLFSSIFLATFALSSWIHENFRLVFLLFAFFSLHILLESLMCVLGDIENTLDCRKLLFNTKKDQWRKNYEKKSHFRSKPTSIERSMYQIGKRMESNVCYQREFENFHSICVRCTFFSSICCYKSRKRVFLCCIFCSSRLLVKWKQPQVDSHKSSDMQTVLSKMAIKFYLIEVLNMEKLS